MKIIEKITLIIYATLMLVVSILLCLLIFGWLDFDIMSNFFQLMITGETTSKILLGVSIIFILLSIKCIFFDSNSKEKEVQSRGVLLENESGKLLISKETLENLVNSVVRDFESAQEVTTRV